MITTLDGRELVDERVAYEGKRRGVARRCREPLEYEGEAHRLSRRRAVPDVLRVQLDGYEIRRAGDDELRLDRRVAEAVEVGVDVDRHAHLDVDLSGQELRPAPDGQVGELGRNTGRGNPELHAAPVFVREVAGLDRHSHDDLASRADQDSRRRRGLERQRSRRTDRDVVSDDPHRFGRGRRADHCGDRHDFHGEVAGNVRIPQERRCTKCEVLCRTRLEDVEHRCGDHVVHRVNRRAERLGSRVDAVLRQRTPIDHVLEDPEADLLDRDVGWNPRLHFEVEKRHDDVIGVADVARRRVGVDRHRHVGRVLVLAAGGRELRVLSFATLAGAAREDRTEPDHDDR